MTLPHINELTTIDLQERRRKKIEAALQDLAGLQEEEYAGPILPPVPPLQFQSKPFVNPLPPLTGSIESVIPTTTPYYAEPLSLGTRIGEKVRGFAQKPLFQSEVGEPLTPLKIQEIITTFGGVEGVGGAAKPLAKVVGAFSKQATTKNGVNIAKQLGVRFDGIQEGIGMQFTDPITGSTTYGNTLEEASSNISNMRGKFAEAAKPKPIVDRIAAMVKDGDLTPEEGTTLANIEQGNLFGAKKLTKAQSAKIASMEQGNLFEQSPSDNLEKFDTMWGNKGKTPLDTGSTYRKIQEMINDRSAGFRQLQKEVGSSIEITPGGEKDLITLLTRGPGAANAGATRYDGIAREIRAVAKGISVDDINTILFAEHGKEILAAKGARRVLAGGFTNETQLDDALTALQTRMGARDYQAAVRATDIVKRTYSEELQRMVGEGFVTAEDAAYLSDKYPWYNPTRYMDYAEAQTALGKKPRPLITNRGIYALSDIGKSTDIQKPLDVLGEQLVRNEVRIVKNQTAKAIIGLAREQPELGVSPIKVFGPAKTLSFWENGKQITYKVPNWIYDEAVMINQTLQNPAVSFIGSLNGISRAAFTSFSPSFVVANMANDSLTAAMTRGILPPQTVATLLRSLRGVQGDTITETFRLAGGYQQRFYGRTGTELARDVGLSGGKIVGDNVSFRKAILDAIPRAGELGEQAPRMALFRRQLDKTLPAWRRMSPEAVAATPQARKAAAEAVELTINFDRGGYLVKAANPLVIFLNASMEGTKLPFRALRENPAARWRLAGAGAAAMGLAAYNMSYPEYFDVPNNIRWNSVMVMLPSKEKDIHGNNKPNYVTIIPRTREWGAFLGSTIYTMERMFADSPTSFGQFTSAMAPQLSPVSDIPIPQILAELQSQIANWDFYWREPIVPPETENLPAGQQSTPWTSDTFRRLGETIGVSPARIQHGATSLLGGAGQAATSVSDYILNMVAPRADDPRIQSLVAQYESLDLTKRLALMTSLDKADRTAVINAMKGPTPQVPIAGPIVRRFVPGRGGQLYQTGEELAQNQLEVSPTQTHAVGKTLQGLSDTFLDEQKASDVRLRQNKITGVDWREAHADQGKKYRGALQALGILYPNAAQVQADGGQAYFNTVATLAGYIPDRRERVQILAAGWHSITPDETIPENPDFETFFKMRDAYKAALTPDDRKLLEEHLAARMTPTEQAWDKARETLRTYWSTADTILGQWPDDLALYKEWQRALPNQRGDLLAVNRWMTNAEVAISNEKKAVRWENPNIDDALVYWYGYKPIQAPEPKKQRSRTPLPTLR